MLLFFDVNIVVEIEVAASVVGVGVADILVVVVLLLVLLLLLLLLLLLSLLWFFMLLLRSYVNKFVTADLLHKVSSCLSLSLSIPRLLPPSGWKWEIYFFVSHSGPLSKAGLPENCGK